MPEPATQIYCPAKRTSKKLILGKNYDQNIDTYLGALQGAWAGLT
jgi:hypothetical protein